MAKNHHLINAKYSVQDGLSKPYSLKNSLNKIG
jgi:hypothetical protein